MTHAESHDLLLDLAYGELDAARAVEVEEHLATCEECRREQADIEEARRLAAPLRALEEPSAAFDARVLRAARTEATMQADGTPGQIVEVSGTVRPLGVEPARVDAHARVAAAPRPKRRRWVVRAAIGGSAAAVAVLALTVTSKRPPHSPQTVEGEYRIDTRAAAEKAQQLATAESSDSFSAPASTPAPAQPKFRKKAKAPASEPRHTGGAGGDVGVAKMAPAATDEAKRAASPAPARPASAPAAPQQRTAAAAPGQRPVDPSDPSPQPTAGPVKRLVAPAANDVAGASARSDRDPQAASEKTKLADVAQARKEAPGAVAASEADRATTVVASLDRMESPAQLPPAAELEQKAQSARHAGNYTLAAGLYRKAAGLRHDANDDSSASWNLAHAVECLAAVGMFDEARKVRDELLRFYPGQKAARSAAFRALREVDRGDAAPERPTDAP